MSLHHDNREVRVAGLTVTLRDLISLLIAGVPGSGKTSVLWKLYFDAIHARVPMTILDTGDEVANYLLAKGPPGIPVQEIDPFFDFPLGVGIYFPAMLTTPTARWRLAKYLSPVQKHNTTPFFEETIAKLIYCAASICHHHSRDYELADILRLAEHRKLMSLLGPGVPGIGDPFANLGMDRELLGNVLISVQVKLALLHVVAALLLRCPRKIDPRQAPGALVVRYRDSHATALEGLYAFLFESIIDHALSRPYTEKRLIVMDEFRQLKPMGEAISAAARRGRKHGLGLVLTLHEIAGLKARYTDHIADELIGLLSHFVFLRQGSPGMSKFCSEILGGPEVIKDVAPHPMNNGGYARGVESRPNVHPDELRNCDLPDAAKDALHGWVRFPGFTAPFVCPWLADVTLPPGHKAVKKIPRKPEEEILERFNLRDMARLNFGTGPEIQEALK